MRAGPRALASGVEGAPVSFAGTAVDPTPTGLLTASWTLGDGNPASGLTSSHAYADNGSYTAILTVSDGEFTVTDTAQVTVANAAPVVAAPSADTAMAGASYVLNASFGDAGSADGPWSYVVNRGDGSLPSQGAQTTPGPIPVSRV